MDGALEEVWYAVTVQSKGKTRVERGRATSLTPAAIGYVNDDLAWHTVGNPGEVRAVSLHFYSPPIDACQYIDSDGKIQTKRMSYFTVDGAPVGT